MRQRAFCETNSVRTSTHFECSSKRRTAACRRTGSVCCAGAGIPICAAPPPAAPRAHLAASLALLSVLGSDGPHELELEGHVVRVDLVVLSVVLLQRRQQQLRDLFRHLFSGQPARRLHRSSERLRRARRTRTGAGGRWREGRTSHAGSPVAFFLTCLFVFGPLRHGTGQAEQARRWACGGGRGSAQRGRGVVAVVAVVMRGWE